MGSKSSKPVAQSARTVLARRAAAAGESPSSTNHGGAGRPLPASIDQLHAQPQPSKGSRSSVDEKGAFKSPDLIEKEVLANMAKLPLIKEIHVSHQTPNQDSRAAPKTASVLRMEEDMLLDSLAVDGGLVDGHVKGRLSEERLVNLYEHLRSLPDIDDSNSLNATAQEYSLSVEVIRSLVSAAKFPLIDDHKNKQELRLAK